MLSPIRVIVNDEFLFFDIFFIILAGLPLLINEKRMYQLLGRIISFVNVCIILALNKWKQPLRAYGMDYVLSLLTPGFGFLMNSTIRKSRIKNIIITSS
ncbi:hypothetical protein CEY12_13615 [Chryseobacterium sp. T16E-39]|nr:hypothetical protein CEY12_13615 [Chryseobacterium sp. T16E-39]